MNATIDNLVTIYIDGSAYQVKAGGIYWKLALVWPKTSPIFVGIRPWAQWVRAANVRCSCTKTQKISEAVW